MADALDDLRDDALARFCAGWVTWCQLYTEDSCEDEMELLGYRYAAHRNECSGIRPHSSMAADLAAVDIQRAHEVLR